MTKRKWGELLVSRFNKWQSRLSLSKISAGAKVLKFLIPPGETFDVIDSVTQGIDKISDAAFQCSTAAKIQPHPSSVNSVPHITLGAWVMTLPSWVFAAP